jgi:hypothetical protein
MVDWSFGVDRSRPEAWNLVGRDDAMAAVAANVLTLFSDMMCGCDEDVKKDGGVQSCIIAESVGLVLRKPRFNISIISQVLCHTKHDHDIIFMVECWFQEH